ncbi:SDR family NAD(P)-dependent oxidoreductase [Streptomyces sp. NPDC001700]
MNVNEEKLVEYLKRVSADLHDTRLRLREVEERSQEPVAVVSVACRFPGGVDTPEALWRLVSEGVDAIGDFPTDRGWDLEGLYHPDPDHPGTTYVRRGGFLADADQFDPQFFGISPREALATSPQQRLLLETAWEAFERAGIDPLSLKGSPTGVYAGTATTGGAASGGDLPEQASEGYAGNAPSLLSGRVSYTFGLEGPAVTVETACSSSLVAIHLASQALRQGECTLALAGGVTVMATPEVFTGFSRQRGLSPDGRCKAFAATADGTGWGEGVGLVLLERLSDARRNGHRVMAVIRGSAINQDGASNGFTAPNGPSQQRVIRQALTSAQLAPSEVDAVEAHGTGTTLGDPIEADALIATYGQDRPEGRPLWLGSLKSNIGHTQGAAGVAGVIKMVMALRHEMLPATLHLDEPTPHVEWDGGGVRLLTQPVEWPRGDRPRRAGVSSFGISGTNAHVIVEQAPEVSERVEVVRPVEGVVPWVVSGRSVEALRGQAGALVARVADAELMPVDVGWSLVAGRSVFEHRAVVVGEERAELVAGVGALAAGGSHPGVVHLGAPALVGVVGPVLVFPGQGSQWVGMGASLLDASPVFAGRVAECERALSPYVDWSLTDVLRGSGGDLGRVDVVQPVLWAVMVSLAAVWAGHGVKPAAVVGHSQGEIAAAVVAGALSLEDGAKVVALRSRALRSLAGGGAMASLGVGQEEASRLLSGLGDPAAGVGVAAVNGPSSTVVSGPPEQVAAVVAACQENGGRARLIDVDYASHGPQVDEIRDELMRVLDGVRPNDTSGSGITFYSTVTGGRISTSGLDTPYWVTNLRERVRFADALEAALADGHRVFIEASTHPVLAVGMEETFERASVDAVTVPTLRRDHGGRAQLVRSLAEAFVAGVPVDWTTLFPADPTPRTVDLPTYAFQRRRFWVAAASGRAGDVSAAGLQRVEHALLPAAVGLPDGGLLLTGRVSAGGGGWQAEHAVAGAALLPGAALVEWALRAADEAGCGGVEELALQVPLTLPESGGLRVQVVVGEAAEDGRRDVRVYSRPDRTTEPGADPGWVCHADGVLSPPSPSGPAEELPGAWPPAHAKPLEVAGFYDRAAAIGYAYGPSFQGLRAVWRDGHDLLAEVALPEAAGDHDRFGIHPAILDAALHPLLLADRFAAADADDQAEAGQLWLPFVWNGVSLWATDATTVRVRLTPRQGSGDGERGLRLLVADAGGAPVLTVDSLTMRPADAEQLRSVGRRDAVGLFTLDWTSLPETESVTADDDDWVVLDRRDSASGAVCHPDLTALAAAMDGGTPAPAVALAYLPAVGEPADDDLVADAELAAVEHALELVQGWLAEPRLADARLAVVTRGAVTGAEEVDLAGAAVWGLLRSAQAEHPDRFVLLDTDPHAHAEATHRSVADAVARAVRADEPQVAMRDGQLLVPRLAVARAGGDESTTERPGASGALDPDGTVLIVGGTGLLGGLVAEHLVRTWQVGYLLLVSRRGPDAPGARELADRLEDLGARVRIAAVDVTDAGAVAELVAGVDAEHPLTGVIHAAGVLDDAVVTSLNPRQVARVWAAKATAAAHLHAATAGLPLGLFVMFSSAAGVVGNAGQAGYAAANAYVDALVARRRGRGLPGLSVAWGLWEQASAMTGHMGHMDLTRLRGMRPLSSERGLALLDAACRVPDPLVVAVDLDVAGVVGGGVPAVLRGLVVGRVRRRVAVGGVSAGGLVGRLVGLDEGGRLDVVGEVVRGCVAVVLGFGSSGEVRSGVAFKELGFDSLTAVELRNRLSAVTGLRLPATMVFDYPTPHALATYLCTRLVGESAVARGPAMTVADSGEPIAIVGMTCRFPGGATSPETLWELVASGKDVIGEFPTGRGWDLDGLFHPDPDHPGTSYANEGGFLHDADAFDAGFFGINPREALATDPQQRLLLEAAWEVVERAGIDPVSLKGSPTGVYAGVMYHDYATGLSSGADAKLEGYAMLAGSGSVVSGRVAYTLGLEGPAVTVDTACSSSLVAMHLAAQALRQGECTLALAGGVTVMATPDVFTGFSRQRGLAPDGRCKPFAAAADGTGWGEGVGLLLLERLSDARRNGHQVLAVIRGSAVNQDGASNGLTAPNGPSQQRVIRQALAGAGLSAAEVDAVEAHGTGTTLGDPIEAQALLATYGQERTADEPLWLGSVKSNIGHTQAAAGVAGVIKMVQAMRHGVLPASLHIDEPTPHVDWDSGAVRLLTDSVEWPQVERPRRAGVSSFGASGTNAHVILEQAPDMPPEAEPVPEHGGAVPWVLSARSAEALSGQAGALVACLKGAEVTPVDVGWSLVSTRSVFEHRAVVVGDDRAELVAAVEALATGESHPDVAHTGAPAPTAAMGPVLVFPGQGAQWAGMGAALLDTSPVFAGRVAECERALSPYVDWSLTDVLRGSGGDLGRVDVVQPVLWAVMVSLAAVWAGHGVKPAAVVGHSQGEIAAAVVAGALSLEDGAKVVALRSRALRQLAGGGAMASLGVGEEQAGQLLARLGDQAAGVGVAAVNGPSSTVISGPPEQVAGVVAACQENGDRARLIDVDYASHGPQIDEIRDELFHELDGIHPNDTPGTGITFYSTVTGGHAATAHLDTAYWVTNLRERVRFADALEAALADGHRVFIETSTHPVLTFGMQETFEGTGAEAVTVPTLRRDHGDRAQLLRALSQAFIAGVDVDWTTLYPASPTPRVVELPTYAFQRERYWLAGHSGRGGDPADIGLVSARHPVLAAAVELADGSGQVLTGRLSAHRQTWLGDHVVADAVLVPGAALAEWALRAADEVGAGGVEELALQVPLVLPPSGGVRLQVVVGAPGDDGRRDVRVYSRPDGDADPGAAWVCHAEGVLSAPVDRADDAAVLGGAWPPAGAEPLETEGFYARVAASGYAYGPSFQGLRAVWRDGADVLAEVVLPDAAGEHGGFGIHPALLDAALHPALLIDQLATGTDTETAPGQVWLPFAWNGVRLWAAEATTVRVRLSPHEQCVDGERALRVTVADPVGVPVLTVDSVAMRPASVDQLRSVHTRSTDSLFTLDWTSLPLTVGTTEPAGDDSPWAVLGADSPYLAGPWANHLADLTALIEALDRGEPTPPVVFADVPAMGIGDELAAEGLAMTERTLVLLQGWLAEPRLADARLVVVTHGAVTDGEDVAAAAVWGLVRSAQSENPGRFLLLDLDPHHDTDTDTVRAAVTHAVESDEPQLAIRARRVLVPRLVRAGAGGAGLVGPVEQPAAWRLDTVGTATLDNVVPVPCPEVLEPLGTGQVRIAVRAAGINFRDVVVSLGMVPGQTGLGGEGAGVVVDIGPGVTEVAVGDEVMGVFDQSFGPLTVTDARLVAPVPAGWTFQQAAAVPVAFLTAWYGLTDLAGLRPGQSVLIHAATGGVGMAAVQIARHVGAEIYATASPGKHAVLEDMGIDAAHRASSRDLDFEQVVREATGGRGVDVVLNSLAGPFVDASLRLLAEDGMLLEMGKTDIRDPEQIAAEYPGVRYEAYDLITGAGTDRIGRMLNELAELFASEALAPPPVRAWPLCRAREALRYLSQAKHTGKLVLDIPAPVDQEGTVLITGGTGTLGGQVAEHLVRTWGVRHLLLVSRSGPDATGAKELAIQLGELGAEVRIAAADVADPDAVNDLVAGIDPAHPLTGVIHAAGVLDDAVVTSQSPERLARVWGAKATAAANLHTATALLPLAMFVMFSSAAGVMGSPGQANYAAANAFCDALAAHRQAAGLPGVSVAWGLWAEASGMTGHLAEADLARMARSGIAAMSSHQALRLLDAACWHGDPQPAAVDLDVRALSAQPADALPALLRALTSDARGATARRTAATGAPAAGLVGRLTALPPAEQHRELLSLVRTQAAAVLGHTDAGAVSSDTPFKDLGFDSLTAVELRNRLAAATGLRLPATFIFRHPTPAAIADDLRTQLCPVAADTSGPVFGELEKLEGAMATFAPDDEARGRLTKRLEALLWRLGDGAPEAANAVGHTVDDEAVEAASDDELFAFIDRELPS